MLSFLLDASTQLSIFVREGEYGALSFQRISYRANWFNLMIYGNCVHIVGFMIVTAWVSSIVTKCGAKTGEKRAGSKALTTD